MPYVLQTGAAGAERLALVEKVYGDHTRRILGRLGVQEGAKIADLGCGTGSTTKWFSSQIGSAGEVVAVDESGEQLALLASDIDRDGIGNVSTVQADAMNTGIDRGRFDIVHCRFLISHVTEPVALVREMAALARPGGLVIAFEVDIGGLFSIPSTECYERLRALSRNGGQAIGRDYEIGAKLATVFSSAGLPEPDMEFIHPVYLRGEEKRFWEYTARESMLPVRAGLTTESNFDALMRELEAVAGNEMCAVAQPRLVACWARKGTNESA
ncbi:class I SAM-dependent methyltransferase [Streptantibioticus ferralitis]|uniref:Methyltransferase domain-containing protein n=1 Tax=Streptantibioticus ferralitis TaxID=236510 RepID=A0ABT5Z4S8_9ACTN|nr:class I SAM-dependent methyltransferase [Streptantibioticus ferralitis]MDF2258829.1 methyltransferase domain-containing protein [Streptantibioticus ferralitis]